MPFPQSPAAGLDFGTSNCAIGVFEAGQPQLLHLEASSTTLPSLMFIPKAPVKQFPVDEAEVAAIVARLQKDMQRPDEIGDLQRVARASLLREAISEAALNYPDAALSLRLVENTQILYGSEAIQMHQEDASAGFLIKSPKSFLAADIRPEDLAIFEAVVSDMLRHIHDTAEQQVEGEIRYAVMGRPVRFHGIRGEEGDQQATAILRRAAAKAGFEEIEFMFEPVAAALDYEGTLTVNQSVLVFDAGGGTTDCTLMRLGPDHRAALTRDKDILGYAGDRLGGNDLDYQLAVKAMGPLLGKDVLLQDGRPVPSSYIFDALDIYNVPVQQSFLTPKTARDLEDLVQRARQPEPLARLLRVQQERLGHHLHRSAEATKIGLSQQEILDVELDYLEYGLKLEVDRQMLSDAILAKLEKLAGLMEETIRQAGVRPEVIYVTGGTAQSPIIRRFIEDRFDGIAIVSGDYFGSVAAGLTRRAQQKFG